MIAKFQWWRCHTEVLSEEKNGSQHDKNKKNCITMMIFNWLLSFTVFDTMSFYWGEPRMNRLMCSWPPKKLRLVGIYPRGFFRYSAIKSTLPSMYNFGEGTPCDQAISTLTPTGCKHQVASRKTRGVLWGSDGQNIDHYHHHHHWPHENPMPLKIWVYFRLMAYQPL